MKKLFNVLLLLSLSLLPCCESTNETNGLNEKDLLISSIMEKSIIHSDFLKYACSQNVFSNQDVSMNLVVSSFIDEYSGFSGLSNNNKENINILSSADSRIITKSESGFQSASILSESLLSSLQYAVDQTPNIDITAIAVNILHEEPYISLPIEDFSIVCATAATYVDSYNYWKNNVSTILESPQTKSWSEFWGYVKRYAIADAEAGLEAAIGCCILGPLVLEAVFVGAGIGSAVTCAEDIIAMSQN